MAGLGIDLLEVDRLETALARRPRLAERLFTRREREYAADRAGARRRRSPRASAPRRRSPRRSSSTPGVGTTWRSSAGGGPPDLRLAGAAAARAHELGRDGRGVADAHARHGRRGRGAEPMSLPRWLDPLLDAEQMRATDAWAIETRGIPSLDLMERAGEGLADAVSAPRARRPRGGRVRQGQQRRRRARRGAAAAQGGPAGRRPAGLARGVAAGRREGDAAPARRRGAPAVRRGGPEGRRT